MIKIKTGQIWQNRVGHRLKILEGVGVNDFAYNLYENRITDNSWASKFALANWIQSNSAVLINPPQPNLVWNKLNQ